MPSTIEYSLCNRRWTKDGCMMGIYFTPARRFFDSSLRRVCGIARGKRNLNKENPSHSRRHCASYKQSLSPGAPRPYLIATAYRIMRIFVADALPRVHAANYLPAMKPSESHFHDIRGLRYHVRTWGAPGSPVMFLLHGWMDVSASFQFLVDAFSRDWHVVAPDWRGFGLTQWAGEGYWFPDYYADLDALLDLYQPGAPVHLVGHSMGGVIACTYAGIRPERVSRVVSLEGFGLARTNPGQAQARYRKWLDELREPPRFRKYRSWAEVAERLKLVNPAP